MLHRPGTRLLALYSTVIFVIISIRGSDGWQYPATFTNNNHRLNSIRSDNAKTKYCNHHRMRILQASDAEDTEKQSLEDTIQTQSLDDDDDLGVPLFDTNDRATLFGLEPNNADGLDPLDNGLQFTGPIIMFASIYICLSLVFGDGMPL